MCSPCLPLDLVRQRRRGDPRLCGVDIETRITIKRDTFKQVSLLKRTKCKISFIDGGSFYLFF